ncbi:hypothetical protein MMC28_010256 [Mycoblastus sanguinarius]|nr:hypothetical protein [Mycoblastus sanguinarius]
MAHAAQLDALTGELVAAITTASSKADADHHKHSALRTFTTRHSGRTNQFEVNARFEGLVEKCRILNNDPLADALHIRLRELFGRSDRWTPEVLSLLLQLSDRPVHNSNVEDLVLFKPDSASAPLTWSDIIADDPLDHQDGVWKNVDFAADGSDEDEINESEQSNRFQLTPDSSELQPEAVVNRLDTLVIPVMTKKPCEIEHAHFWKNSTAEGSPPEKSGGRSHGILVTQLQAVREVIFMLLGSPTSIYTRHQRGNANISPVFSMRYVSQESMANLLNRFAIIGDKLLRIRSWIQERTNVPLEQTFQAALASRIRDVDSFLSSIQATILDSDNPLTITLLELYDEVCNASRLIQQVHEILVDLERVPKFYLPFRILECLFDGACSNQDIGDADAYEYMAKLFFECFHTYLRPIRLWMERGELSEHDQVMFIQKRQQDVPLISLWNDQYCLVYENNGRVHAPNFLHIAAKKIFNTGKSVAFLRHLGHDEEALGLQCIAEPTMDFETVCRKGNFGVLSPFPELFDKSLDTWVANKHHSLSSTLREQLESQCGLQRSFDALEYIYFSRNGAVSNDVTVKLFERIDRGNSRWNDSFILTDLFQRAFCDLPCLDLNRLRLPPKPAALSGDMHRNPRSMSVLDDLRITYTLPWPVSNIINMESIETYQRAQVFLTQVQRAKYLLQQMKVSQTNSRKATPEFEDRLLIAYKIRHRLLWFTDTMLIYLAGVVLSSTTADMRAMITRAEDVDAMITIHKVYITQLEDQCLLAKKHAPIRQAITSMLDLTVLFSDTQALDARRTLFSSDNCSTMFRSNARYVTYIHQSRPSGTISSSSSEDSEPDTEYASNDSATSAGALHVERLENIHDTFIKLHGFVTTAVQGISKADSGPCWEVLANSLAVGL